MYGSQQTQRRLQHIKFMSGVYWGTTINNLRVGMKDLLVQVSGARKEP